MVNTMSNIREHYQDYIIELMRKIGVCDRMYVETGQQDYLDTYDMLREEVMELKAQIKHMESYDETFDHTDREKGTDIS